MVEPPFQPPPAAVEPGQPAIGMAQRAQRGCDAFDGGGMGGRRAATRFVQRGGSPGQQGKDL